MLVSGSIKHLNVAGNHLNVFSTASQMREGTSAESNPNTGMQVIAEGYWLQ